MTLRRHGSVGMVGERLVQGRPVSDWCEAVGAVDRLHPVELFQHPRVGNSVGAREPTDLLEGAIQVEPHREVLAVGEDDMGHRVGIDVGEPVFGDETQLVTG